MHIIEYFDMKKVELLNVIEDLKPFNTKEVKDFEKIKVNLLLNLFDKPVYLRRYFIEDEFEGQVYRNTSFDSTYFTEEDVKVEVIQLLSIEKNGEDCLVVTRNKSNNISMEVVSRYDVIEMEV